MRGVRLDPERVEVRLLLRHKIRYQVGHAERLPYRAGAFDVVLFSWSL